MLEEILDGIQSLHFDTLTLNPTKVNRVERWSKVGIILFIGPTIWVLSVRELKDIVKGLCNGFRSVR
jgi:hypothetical protein